MWFPKRSIFELILAFGIYALASVFSKGASMHGFLSWPYLFNLAGAVLSLGLYAILWQQIIKRMDISDAFMFKGLALVFVLVLSHFLFHEPIGLNNLAGAAIIVGGIALYAKS